MLTECGGPRWNTKWLHDFLKRTYCLLRVIPNMAYHVLILTFIWPTFWHWCDIFSDRLSDISSHRHIFWHSIWHIYIIIYITIYIYCMYVDIWSAFFYAFYLTLCMAFFLAFDLAFYLTSCWYNMINLHTIWRALSHILWHSTWHIFWHSLTLYSSFDPTFDMHFFLRV